MAEDPRNRPGPPRSRPRPSHGAAAGGAQPGLARLGRVDPRNRPRPADEHPVTRRPARDVLIIPVGDLPAGADPVDLAALLERLRGDHPTAVRPIGRVAAPDAIAATLTESEIADLVVELGGRAKVVDDTPINL